MGFPSGSGVKNLPAKAGDRDVGLIPGLRRFPGGGNGNPIQYSRLEKSMDREAWWAVVHGVLNSWTRLSNWTCMYTQNLQRMIKVLSLSFHSNAVGGAKNNKQTSPCCNISEKQMLRWKIQQSEGMARDRCPWSPSDNQMKPPLGKRHWSKLWMEPVASHPERGRIVGWNSETWTKFISIFPFFTLRPCQPCLKLRHPTTLFLENLSAENQNTKKQWFLKLQNRF